MFIIIRLLVKIKFMKRTKAALVSESLRSKIRFYDYTRNVYASNKTCTVCGAKNLFPTKIFQSPAMQFDNLWLPV